MTHYALALGAVLALAASPALADPCKAIADDARRLPDYLARGALFSGPVVYVADGDGLCVETGERGATSGWVEVRIEDFYAPELKTPAGLAAKQALDRITRGREVTCVSAGRKTWDRVVAVCRLGGVSLADRMRRAGIREGGNAWRPNR